MSKCGLCMPNKPCNFENCPDNVVNVSEPFFTENDFEPSDIATDYLIHIDDAVEKANAKVAPVLKENRFFREFLINVNKRVMPGVTDTIDEAVNRVRSLVEENATLKAKFEGMKCAYEHAMLNWKSCGTVLTQRDKEYALLKGELDAAVEHCRDKSERIQELESKATDTVCAYCHVRFSEAGTEQISQHVLTCKSHPLAEENARLKARIMELSESRAEIVGQRNDFFIAYKRLRALLARAREFINPDADRQPAQEVLDEIDAALGGGK